MAKLDKNAPARPRLGRGLSSLISNSAAVVAETPAAPAPSPEPAPPASAPARDVVETPAPAAPSTGQPVPIEIASIMPNPYQPRRTFQPEDLAELTASIAQQGILQPLIVTPTPEGDGPQPFTLIAGERRLRAAAQAGLTEVPCVIRQASRREMLEWALIENIQRADLNPVEKALAFRDYMDRYNLTQVEAAQQLGQARATIANILRMLDLCDEVQAMLIGGALSFGHAKVLAGLATRMDRQLALAKKVVAEGLSVRQTESLMTALRDGQPEPAAAAAPAAKTKPAYLIDLEEQLTQVVGTRVKILPGRAKHTGRIVLDYYNLDDFDRIAGGLGLKIES